MIYRLMATGTSIILLLIFLTISGTLLQLSQYLHIFGLLITSFGCLVLQEYTTRKSAYLWLLKSYVTLNSDQQWFWIWKLKIPEKVRLMIW
jgi:hypothetical protein